MNSLNISSFGRVLIRFTSSQVLSNLIRILAGFLVVRILDPGEYGIYTGIGVYLGYFALGHIGVINGLGREFPFQLGRKNDEYGKQLANTAFTVTFLIGIFSALAFLVISIVYFLIGKNLEGFTFLSYVIVAGLNLFNTQFLPVLYRTNADFEKLSQINLIFGVINLLSVILVWSWGFYGILIRGILLSLVQFFLLFKAKPYKLRLNFIRKDFIHLLKTGVPIFIVGQVNPLWTTVVNNIIYVAGGATNFGLFALSNIVQSTFQIIPQSFGQVIYPRMTIMYGEGKKPQEIIRLNLKAIYFQFIVMLIIALCSVVLLPYAVKWLLPNYYEGVTAAQWIIFVPVIYSFGAINNMFNVTGKQKYYFLSLIIGALIGTFYIIIHLLTTDFRLEIFPQGLLIGKFVQQVLSLYFIRRLD